MEHTMLLLCGWKENRLSRAWTLASNSHKFLDSHVSQRHLSCQILCSHSQILFLPPGPSHQNHSPVRGENPPVNLLRKHEQISILAHLLGRWGGSYGELVWLCIWGVQTTPVDQFLTRDEEPSRLGGYTAGSSLFWAPTHLPSQNWGQYLTLQFSWQICGALHKSLSSPANCSRTYSVLTCWLFSWRLDMSKVQYGKAQNL